MNTNTITQQFTILGVTVSAQVPATAADWDAIQGQGACVQEAITNHGYRGYAGPVRNAIIKALAAAGYEKLDGEKDQAFVKRLAESGVDVHGTVAGAANAVSFIGTMTGTSRAEVGKEFLEQAQGVVDKIESGAATLDGFLAKMRKLVPEANVEDPTDTVAIARVIRAFRKRQAADELA